MPGAYWVTTTRRIHDAEKVKAYVALAVPAVEAGGGRFLARGVAAAAFEVGLLERTTLIAFDSVEQAVATYESDAYRAALRALDGGSERDIRIVEALSD